MTKEEIYDCMTVGFVVPSAVIPYEFEDGKGALRQGVRRAGAHLRAHRHRLRGSGHLLEMVECMEEIAKICALKMYDYGVRLGRAE